MRLGYRALCKALAAAQSMHAIKKPNGDVIGHVHGFVHVVQKFSAGKAILSGDTSPQRQKTTSRAATVAAQSPKAPVRRSGECQNRKVSDSLLNLLGG